MTGDHILSGVISIRLIGGYVVPFMGICPETTQWRADMTSVPNCIRGMSSK